MILRKPWLALAVVYSFFLSTLAVGEVRKLTQEDIEWGDPATTVTSTGGHVGHKLSYIVKSPQYIDVRDYGSGSVTLAGVQAAVDAAGGTPVVIPSGAYSFSGTVTLPNNKTIIIGDNVTINQTGSAPTFLQTNHVYTEISGIRFTGNGNGIKFSMTPNSNMYRDYLIDRCEFATDSGVYGIYDNGTRSGYIQNSLFEGAGNGIYLTASCVPFVVQSTFKGTNYLANAIFYDGDGTGFSCGIGIRDSEILGYDNGLILNTVDWANVTGSTIDFNNNSVRIEDSQYVTISGGNYIGSVGDNAAIWIGQGSTDKGYHHFSSHLNISNSHIIGHINSGSSYDPIRITDGSWGINITGNTIGNYTRYGINFDNITITTIAYNELTPYTALGTYSIYNSGTGGDSTVYITGNSDFVHPPGGLVYARMRDNQGFVTRWSGVSIIDNTAKPVSHLLNTTPTTVTFTTSENHPVWVTNITSTQFTINTDNTYAAFGVYWTAETIQGQ